MNMRESKSIYLLLFFVAVAMSGVVNAQSMQTTINAELPNQDPYCVTGSALLTGVDDDDKARLCPRVPETGNVTVSSHVVDWIVVELRSINHGGTAGSTNARNAATVLARKPAFLLTNGRIVDAELYAALDTSAQDPASCTALTQHDNCPDVEFEEIASEVDDIDLYLVIRHRNHLDVISSTHLTESTGEAGVYAYDFSSGTAAVLDGVLKSKSGTFAMLGGDINGTGTVTAADYAGGVATALGGSGYDDLASDVNFSNTITSADYAGVIADNLGKGAQLPQ